MPQSGKLPVLNLLRPKIWFFAPQGRLVSPIQVKLGTADGHLGPLGCAKFHLNRRRGWECGPKISKISTLVKSRLARANRLRASAQLSYISLSIKFDLICFTGYGVIAEKPRVGQLGHIFPCTL